GAWGDRRVIKSRLQMLDNEHELSIDRYTEANTAAKTREEITDLMDVETWMTAEQALEMGFIDQVIDKKDKESPAVDNSLRQFKKAPVAVLNLLSPADPEPPAVETHSIMKEQLTEVLGMAPSATDAQVQNRVAELMRENTQLKDERDQKIQNAAEEKAKSLVDNAITAKQIPGADRELWMKDAVENYDLVERTINRIPKPVQLSKQQGFIGPDATMAGVKGKKFSELQQDHPEVLEQLRASDRDQYNALFKAEFGFEPSLDR
ncbi:MAG: ATP-dependent Clp protease proteolytic subunit, partial [Bacteroidota bacterium]